MLAQLMPIVLLHGSGIDDLLLVLGGIAYIVFMIVATRIKKARVVRRKAERQAAKPILAALQPEEGTPVGS